MLVYVQSSRLSADAAGASKMESVRTDLVCGKFCIYIAVIGIFLLLGRDFECTCKPQVFDCNLYLVLPVFIIFLFILWTDRSFQTVCRFLISDAGRLHTFSFWGSFFRHIVKAAFIGLLWVVVVLVDGSWYVCCQNDLSEQQAQIPCRSTGRISEEERVRRTSPGWVGRLFLTQRFLPVGDERRQSQQWMLAEEVSAN